jgi:dihydroxyacetone kinase
MVSDNLIKCDDLGVKTMGVGLTPCIIPAVGKATFALESDEMEVGLGKDTRTKHGAVF